MRIASTLTLLLLCGPVPAGATVHGLFAKWSKIEISFTGLDSRGHGKPNPFLVRLNVNFTSPTGNRCQVPGFYDGDGKGGLDGNIWKVRFAGDELGQWSFKTISDDKQLDGVTGRFTVKNTDEEAEGFWKWGRLEFTVRPRTRFVT